MVTALSRQGLNAPGTGAILHSAGAVVTPAVTQCLGFSIHDTLVFEALGLYREEAYGEHGGSQPVTEDEKSKIVRENAIKLYGLALDEPSACR